MKRPLWLVLLALACCRSGGSAAPPAPARWSDAAMLAEGARFLDDAAFRRTALVESLTNPKNTYSRQRLTSYGLSSKGWDLLPEWNPRSVTVTRPIADAVASGQRPRLGPEVAPLWDGKRPTTMAGWIALGRETFFRYPLRREVVVEWALGHPDVARRVGIRQVDDGTYPGVVAFIDARGQEQIGMTCAVCHSDPDSERGHGSVGRARRSFDYGALRLAYSAMTGRSIDPDLARRMKTWGPGRADVTEDDDEDPVAIPDLWGLRHQTSLTQAGTIKHTGPTALAIRQETQLLTSNHQTVRPPRELAFALAMFLYSLEPPPLRAESREAGAASHRGRALFERRCASCHSNAAGGGDPVSVDRVDTDPSLANGGARGTGLYRPAGLVRVGDAAPYFHDGSVATLEDVLSPDRIAPSFRRGLFGPGPIKGHVFGTDLSPSERADLASYLRTL